MAIKKKKRQRASFRNKNDEYLAIAVDDRGIEMNAIDHIKDLTQFVIDFEALQGVLSTPSDVEVLTIASCPSESEAFNQFPSIVDDFFTKTPTSIGVKLEINEEFDQLSDQQLFQLMEVFKNIKKSFLIAFESTVDKSSFIYWRFAVDEHFFSLKVESNETKVGDFVGDVLMKTLRHGFDGLHGSFIYNKNRINVSVDASVIVDLRNFNLLQAAADVGNTEIIKFFLDLDFDVNKQVGVKVAVDLAYEKQHFNAVLELLKANSRFPTAFSTENFASTGWTVSQGSTATSASTILGSSGSQRSNGSSTLSVSQGSITISGLSTSSSASQGSTATSVSSTSAKPKAKAAGSHSSKNKTKAEGHKGTRATRTTTTTLM